MNKHKKYPLIILVFGALLAISATHDFFLLPENFFLHKGDKLNLHLVEGDQFVKSREVGFHAGKVATVSVLSGKKKTDLASFSRDSIAMVMDYPVETTGQNLIIVTTGVDHSNYS